MRKSKWLLMFIMVLAVASTLAACGDEEASSEGDSEDVTLKFWTFGATNYEELAKEYEKENPGVTVEVKTSENADHHNSLFTALSAGTGAPDLAMVEIDQLDRFKEAQDRFVNLYELGAEEIQGNYLDWKWQIGENNENDFLFGLPTDIGPKVMFYRTDLFEKSGLPTNPDEVQNMIGSKNDLIQAGETIKEETGKPLVDSMEMVYRAVIDGATESYYDEEGNLLVEEEGNAVKEAYDLAVEFNEHGLVGSYEMWSPEWGDAVNGGDFAIEMGAAWLKGWMSDNAPDAEDQFRVAKLPEEFAGNWGGSYITIPGETDDKEEAYKFVKWLTSPDNQLNSFKSDAGLFPSTPEVYDREEFKEIEDDYFGGQKTSQYFADAATDISFVYKGSKYIPTQDEVLNALQNVYDGADPDKEWEAAVQRMKDVSKR
ncbi:ABC transporter substrate-binding protein [Lentibacillus salicampi]|uniref:Carbohydrate ABC transporter substrate-binding protein n=1 Tax=Lentibacillus salicampi TaxID=175306 RepID=A0A4Y9AFN6_9BACI|nr:ABC transporter substrate-binding protein [Lentibacillus salicampi]TFJ93211.1 carbohydrate ABC transporter substrate-binding protein [Lentibacillus salicampi]